MAIYEHVAHIIVLENGFIISLNSEINNSLFSVTRKQMFFTRN